MFKDILAFFWDAFGKSYPVPFRFALFALCLFVGGLAAEFLFRSSRTAHRIVFPEQYKQGAKLQLSEWTAKQVAKGQIEVVGRYFNNGDIETRATFTSEVLLNGKDAAKPGEKGPDQLDYPLASPIVGIHPGGPIFYLDGARYDAAINHPDTLQIRSHFIYPDGLGAEKTFDQIVQFAPGLRLMLSGGK